MSRYNRPSSGNDGSELASNFSTVHRVSLHSNRRGEGVLDQFSTVVTEEGVGRYPTAPARTQRGIHTDTEIYSLTVQYLFHIIISLSGIGYEYAILSRTNRLFEHLHLPSAGHRAGRPRAGPCAVEPSGVFVWEGPRRQRGRVVLPIYYIPGLIVMYWLSTVLLISVLHLCFQNTTIQTSIYIAEYPATYLSLNTTPTLYCPPRILHSSRTIYPSSPRSSSGR